jgi:hypothetical protein
LGGVFDCPSRQAAELARSCGALPDSPFAQVFKETLRGTTKYYFHPAFLFVIGGANRKAPLQDDQPERLAWLRDDDIGASLALVRGTRETKDLPSWSKDAATFNETLPHLGTVLQKGINLQWWVPYIHQLVLYVGTARQGKGARKRQHMKAHQSREMENPARR